MELKHWIVVLLIVVVAAAVGAAIGHHSFWKYHGDDQLEMTSDFDHGMPYQNMADIEVLVGEWEFVFYSDKFFKIETDAGVMEPSKFDRNDGENFRLTVPVGTYQVHPTSWRQIVHLRGEKISEVGMVSLEVSRTEAEYGAWRPPLYTYGTMFGSLLIGLLLALWYIIVVG